MDSPLIIRMTFPQNERRFFDDEEDDIQFNRLPEKVASLKVQL